MANSLYYLGQYHQYKSTVKSLNKNIEALTNIRNKLGSDYYDEQGNTNKELNDLKEDLNKAVRHDGNWDAIASQCELYKEKAATADTNLNSAIDYLDEEIRSLNSQKSTAESNQNQAYSNYQTQKNSEIQDVIETVTSIF